MYAVILSGGKQYRVQEGDILKLETISAKEGDDVNFDKILLIGENDNFKVGLPFLSGYKVTAKIKSHGRHKKIHTVKFRRRKHHEKWQGHRQNYTEVEITGIKTQKRDTKHGT